MKLGTADVNGQYEVVVRTAAGSAHLATDLVGLPTLSLLDLVADPLLTQKLEEAVERRSGETRILPEPVMWVAPIPQPLRNIFCVGWNYMPHYEEGHRLRDYVVPEIPLHPALFTKAPSTVVGEGPTVIHPAPYSDELDWEGELAVVIGKSGINIPEDTALDHIFGYTIANDISVRDFQKRHGNQWFKGKSFDTHCPMGPVIVTASDIVDPQNLELTVTVNGEVKQHASTSTMIFTIARLIHEISVGMRLEPGDIILSGTPAGVGATEVPPRFLKSGDIVEVDIPPIGTLTSAVVSGPVVAETR